MYLTLDAQAGLALLYRHESILDLQQLSRPAEGCQREAVRRVPHGILCVFSFTLTWTSKVHKGQGELTQLHSNAHRREMLAG